MSKRIALTCGTSILRNLEQHGVHAAGTDGSAKLTKGFLTGLGPTGVAALSAEMATLSGLSFSRGDEVVLLATDTPLGTHSAKLVARVTEEAFQGAQCDVVSVTGLVLNDVDKFRQDGLAELVRVLDRQVDEARRRNLEPCLALSGGIKPVVPYVAVFAMMRSVPLFYQFETESQLLEIPRIPLSFDWASLSVLEGILHALDAEVEIPRKRLVAELGEMEASRLEGFFEAAGDGKLTLSPLGLLLLGDLDQTRTTSLLLSPRAAAALTAATDQARDQFEFMLNRVRNPFWRAHKRHNFTATDLEVWKPGRTAQRMAGWSIPESVYVAELYATHGEYERDLPGRTRADYDIRKFTPWEPPAQTDLGPMSESERSGQILVDRALLAEEAARDDLTAQAALLEEEFAQRSQLEAELARVGQALEAARNDVDRLRSERETQSRQEAQRQTWGVLRRLRWALSGG